MGESDGVEFYVEMQFDSFNVTMSHFQCLLAKSLTCKYYIVTSDPSESKQGSFAHLCCIFSAPIAKATSGLTGLGYSLKLQVTLRLNFELDRSSL